MIDFTQVPGPRALERLIHEDVIWLTTLSPRGVPSPRPVWFVWDGANVLIYTEPHGHKLAHIRANPNVSLHFDASPSGVDVQVLTGTAMIDDSAPRVSANLAYLAKMQAGIAELGMSSERYAQLFSVALRVTPVRLRGLDVLPVL